MEHRIHHLGSLANSTNMGKIDLAGYLMDSMPHLLGFPKSGILNLFHPSKVSFIGLDFLLDSSSGYRVLSSIVHLLFSEVEADTKKH